MISMTYCSKQLSLSIDFQSVFREFSENCLDPSAELERAGPGENAPLVIIPRRSFTIRGTLVNFTSGRS
jgi:hypothetical protein